MKKSVLEQFLLYDYRYAIGYCALIILAVASLVWRLGSVVPGLTAFEADYVASFYPSWGWDEFIANPINWPYRALTSAAVAWLPASITFLRVPSIILAAIGLAAFFWVIQHRFKTRVAIIATALLATSSWWLAYARSAHPAILSPVLLLLLIVTARKAYEQQSGVWFLLSALLVGLTVYVPYGLYIILLGLILSKSLVSRLNASMHDGWFYGSISIIGVFCIPLVIAVAKDASIAYQLLGLPLQGTIDLAASGQGIIDSVSRVFWNASEYWSLRLGSLPFLDIFSSIMVLLGLYHMDHEISRSLTKFTLLAAGVLLVLTNLAPQPGNDILILPFMYILIASGIVVLFAQWYEIFPRNPIARMTALIPSVLLISGVMWYHQQRYFVAWARTPQTLEVAPPASAAIVEHSASRKSQETIIVTTAEQRSYVTAAVIFAPHMYRITTSASAAEGQDSAIITDAVYQTLNPEQQSQIRQQYEPKPTPYSLYPVSVWVSR